MKPIDQSWHEYLTELRYENVELPDEYLQLKETLDIERNKIFEVYQKCMPYLIEYNKAVPDRKFPKQIIKEKTKVFYGSDKYPPYSFRLQCLITGDQSKLLKIADYPSYGILKSDAQNGGDFPYKSEIENRLKVVEDYKIEQISIIQARIDEIYNLLKDFNLRINLELKDAWFMRYNEYLYSDEWKKIRNKVVLKDNGCCLKCDSDKQIQVHHITYETVGKECVSDLLTLCRTCHEEIHNCSHEDRINLEQLLLDQREINKI